ncbi:hypothetical protein JAAARDRAFT_191904 [Jaapia argillacea MUCL 33604]|uniref:Uncharacterized protein n=1 Tax=Jaapia argillacea MUCL 33604 TaxID=933084 RepID=A0A067Q0Q1_9AGAM|nr:hypothetical protein JAAARDRAFT_191904 [Jaapia argillacea MUCL 33604]
MFGVPLHEDCAICNRYFTHGIADEARFRTHVKAQAESLRSSSDALRELQANMAHLEAQAASNEVRAQGLVSRVAELEAEAHKRESAVLRANTTLVDTQHRLKEAQARITTGTTKLAYMQGQLDHMNCFSGHASGSNAVELLNDSSSTVSWGNSDLAQPSTSGWGLNTQDIPLAASEGRWGNVDAAPVQEATARRPAPAPISEAPVLPTEHRQDDGRAMVFELVEKPPIMITTLISSVPFCLFDPTISTMFVNESCLKQINMIQVWLWINTVAAPLSREDHQLFSTSTLSLIWTPGTFANYRRANPCKEVFDVTHFSGDPTSPDQVLEYWNDTGIMLDQATMFTRFYNYHSAAQAHPATHRPARQRNPSTDIPCPLATDDPMGERVDYGDNNSTDGDISLSPEALALGQMGMALTAIAMVAGIIPPDPEGCIASSLKPVVDTRSLVDDNNN